MSDARELSLLTLEEAAKRVRVSTKTLRRAIAAGDLPAYRPGRLNVVREKDLNDWLEDKRVPRATPSIPGGALQAPRSRARGRGLSDLLGA